MIKRQVRVLIADTEERVRSAMFRALLDREVYSDCVSNGGDAITPLAERQYDLVMLDFALPHAGAAAVVESLRLLAADKRPIVIAIASVAEHTRDTETDLVHMILRKPLRIGEVAEMIDACLTHVRTA